jgi:GDP-L-fucose synthase
MQSTEKIFVAGHRGMAGGAIVRSLLRSGASPEQIITRTHLEVDLTDQSLVSDFFERERPTQVYLAAAKVGGIHANNTFPADFIYRNLMIQSNVINAAFRTGTRRLLFLGSSCIYPREAPQPMREEALLSGKLEPTNEPYAIAKIAGIKLCESYNRQFGVDFRSVMPTNLFGPGDNYHPENSHVVPALIRRFHEAKLRSSTQVAIWGSGRPRREFLFVDDMADASVHVMHLDRQAYDRHAPSRRSHINVGFGEDITIAEVARSVADVVGFVGEIVFDTSKPDGAPQKLLDSHRIRTLGWAPKVSFLEGLRIAYKDFLENHASD